MQSNPSIHFMITGGTIDSYYDGTKDTAVPNDNSIIPRYIKSLKLYNQTEFTVICMKDSRAINKDDLHKLIREIEKSRHKHIIITHGTYTMPDTARFLEANLKRKDQTIILIAAMLPMTEFTMSDGPFNLGFAIAKAQELPHGIYVCMNGKSFSADEVVKVISEGRFASVFGEK
ncbi:asparaginase domain-containing protein [Patescibacteria group bacterium]|nr:asparaginase domain-containing protein [Patescibacteria group bacterium]MCL5798343.1 asparaginase domain-containing protein [Patescibacteria group bacterium]